MLLIYFNSYYKDHSFSSSRNTENCKMSWLGETKQKMRECSKQDYVREMQGNVACNLVSRVY